MAIGKVNGILQYLIGIDKPKVALPSKLVSLSECQLQQENNYIYEKLWETKLLQAGLARNGAVSTSIQLKKGWI